jgi:hypothetical protein
MLLGKCLASFGSKISRIWPSAKNSNLKTIANEKKTKIVCLPLSLDSLFAFVYVLLENIN